MPSRPIDRDGFALVTSLLVVVVLSLLAVAAVMLSSTEKRTTVAERVHGEAVFAADAGGEAAVNFLRLCDAPPQWQDVATRSVQTADAETLQGAQQYGYDCRYLDFRGRLGWSTDYYDFNYRVMSNGEAAANANSDVEMVASRLFRAGGGY